LKEGSEGGVEDKQACRTCREGYCRGDTWAVLWVPTKCY